MFVNIVWAICMLAVAGSVIWLTLRARKLNHWAAKTVGFVIGGLFSLILLIVSVAGARGIVLLYTPRGKPTRDLKVERTPERIARGQHIANILCAGCHTLDGNLPLGGGRNLSDEARMPLGDLYPINLTPAGPLATWTDGEIFRAVREGADNSRRRLPVMSAQRARNLSDDDLMSVIAFLRSQPSVQRETPLPAPSYLLAVMSGANMVPSVAPLEVDTLVAPAEGATVEYGKYMTGWIGCDECHGANLTGGGGGVVPVGPNLRSVKNWSADGFITTMRTGKTPFGKQLDSLMMPYKNFGRASDVELTAIHAYLVSLP